VNLLFIPLCPLVQWPFWFKTHGGAKILFHVSLVAGALGPLGPVCPAPLELAVHARSITLVTRMRCIVIAP
jgi:hypothetical protein